MSTDMTGWCALCRAGSHNTHNAALGGICVGCACPVTAADRPSVPRGEQPCRHCGSCDGPPSCPDCDHADRPSVTDNARAVREAAMNLYRALRRTNPDALAEVEDWTYWENIVRAAQVALAAGRAETTTATTEDAEEVLHGAGWFARADLDPRDLRGILHDLADAGLLATARTRPTRDKLDRVISDGLRKHGAFRTDLIADAVLALFRGGDK